MIEIINNEIHATFNMPPSLNKLFSGKKRRYKSEDYEGFQNYMMVEFCNSKERPRIVGDEWLEVEYIFYFSLYTKEGKKRIKDSFNFEKALSDTLERHIEGFKDHKIKRGIVEKVDSDKNIVRIIIRELID